MIKLDEKYAKLLELNVGDPGLVAYNQCFFHLQAQYLIIQK